MSWAAHLAGPPLVSVGGRGGGVLFPKQNPIFRLISPLKQINCKSIFKVIRVNLGRIFSEIFWRAWPDCSASICECTFLPAFPPGKGLLLLTRGSDMQQLLHTLQHLLISSVDDIQAGAGPGATLKSQRCCKADIQEQRNTLHHYGQSQYR